jgi:hypothetical protein
MAAATVSPLARFPLFTTFTIPVIQANQPFTLPAQPACLTYMPYPDGQGDITWQGAEFGLSAPAGANVTLIQVTVTHRVSDTTAYPSVTAQLYAGGSPIGSPAAFTPSITLITETITYTAGITPANLATLAVRLTFHSAAMGLAYVHQAYATANYSFASAVGIITVAGTTRIGVPALTVHTPVPRLVSLGTAVQALTPAFGTITSQGNLLIGWTFSNSGSASFDTTCSDPQWTLIGHSGGVFSWRALWYKSNCHARETPPVFTSPGGVLMSQLAEFTNARGLDQSGTYPSPSSADFTMSATSQDTASGDLITGIAIWAGANDTPAVPTLTGTDSGGNTLPVSTTTNGATTGWLPYAFTWARASPAAGPGTDSLTGGLNIFDGGGGIIASFFAYQVPAPVTYAASMASM